MGGPGEVSGGMSGGGTMAPAPRRKMMKMKKSKKMRHHRRVRSRMWKAPPVRKARRFSCGRLRIVPPVVEWEWVDEGLEASPGFEPGYKDLQSSA
jgi:hypothetical protein